MAPNIQTNTNFNIVQQKMQENNYSDLDIQLVEQAYTVARMAHEGQKRKTGEPYFVHCFATAMKLLDLDLPANVIAAGFLHDVAEDTEVTLEELETLFGIDIATMVKAVTKLGHVKYRGMDRYVENLRKMFLAMAKDVRVIFIKFADRMHNMETLYVVPEHKRERIAKEVMEIYAPIANRLGMGEYRGLFEDYSFKYLQPKEYNWTKHLLEQRAKRFGPSMKKAEEDVMIELKKNNLKNIRIQGRIKYCHSLYKKMQRYENDINKVYDIIALRIITDNISDCYSVLGTLHSLYKPLSGRIKDYIAQPKPNGYQSLHTTVFSDDGAILEFQIRTSEMHDESEYGVAAHWRYKENSDASKTVDWMKELSNIQRELSTDDFIERLDELKLDMFQDRIFVFSPQGDVFDLPVGSTPIDFAYFVHTDIGHQAISARVNHQSAQLHHKLRSGDLCEIITNPSKRYPNADWLDFVKTHQAKQKIRAAMKRDKKSLLGKLMGR